MTVRAPKCPDNVTGTFFNTVYLVRKDLRFEHGGAKLASCLGRHLTSLRPCMHQLLLPKLVKVTLGGIFLKEFCYTSGNPGSIWPKFCSPSKTTKLVQISIGLPERASQNAATERTSFLRER